MKYLLSIFITLLLFSCEKKVESKLDFEKLGVLEENRFQNPGELIELIKYPDSVYDKYKGVKLSFWDKYNLNQLKSTNTGEDDFLKQLTENDFKFSFTLDSSFYIDKKLSNKNLELVGSIENKTNNPIFFIGTSCYALGENLRFNKNAVFNPYIHCNMSWISIEIIKPNDIFEFKSTISVRNKDGKINSNFDLSIISNNVNLKDIKPIQILNLKGTPQYISENLKYIIESKY